MNLDKKDLKLPNEKERELLAWLSEELGEAQQVIGKINRFGFTSSHPKYHSVTNKLLLEKELGHVMAAAQSLMNTSVINYNNVLSHKADKSIEVQEYLLFN